jgi:cell division protein FtsB
VGEDLVASILCCLLVAFLLPLGAMLYLDILEAKNQVKAEVEKVEKLRREIEKERRDANSDRSE